MKFVRHPEHNRFMGAPADWDEKRDGPCLALSIHDMRDRPLPVMESCWELEGFEPLTLALGLADIRLAVYSRVHPAVSLVVYPKTGMTREDVKTTLTGVLRKLAHYAEINELTIKLVDGKVEVAEKA